MAIKKKEISRELILLTAKQLFSIKGYSGTSMEDLAKKYKISKPALYYYFKNKIEILETLYSESFEQLVVSSDKIFSSNLTTEQKFKELIMNHATSIATDAELVKVFFHEEKELPRRLMSKFRKKREKYIDRLIKLYKKGVLDGSFRGINPTIAINTIMGACNWIYMWYSKKGKLNEGEMAKLITEILCRGYLTKNQK